MEDSHSYIGIQSGENNMKHKSLFETIPLLNCINCMNVRSARKFFKKNYYKYYLSPTRNVETCLICLRMHIDSMVKTGLLTLYLEKVSPKSTIVDGRECNKFHTHICWTSAVLLHCCL